MRRADCAEGLADAFDTAKAEARANFGDDAVYMEKFIVEPKHVEVQLMADKHGNVVHLYERDCSCQRRNQKLLEESPSKALTPELRERMGAAAVAAFNTILPGTLGGTVIQISLLFFALSTILGWSYYGEQCWSYLFKGNKAVLILFKIVFIAVCVVGATGNGTLVWDISDTLNGMMAIPNLVALLALSGVTAAETKRYFNN